LASARIRRQSRLLARSMCRITSIRLYSSWEPLNEPRATRFLPAARNYLRFIRAATAWRSHLSCGSVPAMNTSIILGRPSSSNGIDTTEQDENVPPRTGVPGSVQQVGAGAVLHNMLHHFQQPGQRCRSHARTDTVSSTANQKGRDSESFRRRNDRTKRGGVRLSNKAI
jgi:hypothetical protein